MGSFLPQAPQAGRVEAKHQHPPLRHQHTLHLAQGLVRVDAEIQRQRQHHQIQAGRFERQRRAVAQQRGAGGRLALALAGEPCQPAPRHAIGTQALQLGQTQLQRVVTEHIHQRLVAPVLHPIQGIGTGGGFQPLAHPYNLRLHGLACHSCFFGQLHLGSA